MPRYPDIEPYETGLLNTGDGNLVYWETCGNPDGVPALIVHGGPGSGCTAGNRRSFDPEKFRIIIFDQRNCGRSLPHASDPAADMSLNTTEYLLRDMEQLREHLGVEKWLLRGGSWGVTLSLAYAERHPGRVSGMLMLSVTSTRRLEIDWLYRGVGRFFPEAWVRFRDFAGLTDSYRLPTDGTPAISGLLEAYSRMMEDPDSVSGRGPRPSGWPGRTRSSRRKATGPPARTATGPMTRSWRSCASARITSRTTVSSRTAC